MNELSYVFNLSGISTKTYHTHQNYEQLKNNFNSPHGGRIRNSQTKVRHNFFNFLLPPHSVNKRSVLFNYVLWFATGNTALGIAMWFIAPFILGFYIGNPNGRSCAKIITSKLSHCLLKSSDLLINVRMWFFISNVIVLAY